MDKIYRKNCPKKRFSYPRVVVCITSYNNHAELSRLIDCIADQSVAVHSIVILENSDDSEIRRLNKSLMFSSKIEITISEAERNLGSAGGFSKAMSLAIRENVDAVWLLDQDGEVKTDCLEKLLDYYDSSSILCPVVLTRKGEELCYFRYFTNFLGKNLGTCILDTKNKCFLIDGFGTHGVLIPKSVVNEIGVYDSKHFFVGFEDYDYSHRARRHNVPIMLIRSAIVYHPDLGQKHGLVKKRKSRRLESLSNFLPPFLGAINEGSPDRFVASVYSRSYIIGKYYSTAIIITDMLYSALRILALKALRKDVLLKKTLRLYVSGIKEGIRFREERE